MAHKHLRSIVIKEVAQPKTSGEKSFVAKHVIVKHPDRNGNDDRVFKAAKTKVIKRSPRHGYDAGQDEKVYEDQQNVEEDVQLDESVAREHYIRHHNNALQHAKEIVKHLQTHSKLIDSCPSCHSGHIQDMKMLADNLAGSNLQIGQHVESEQRMAADRKKWSKPQPLVREQEEQIDELSKQTLTNYLLGKNGKPGAVQDYSNIRLAQADHAKATPNDINNQLPASKKFAHLASERKKGVNRAIKRLGEQQIDEGGHSQILDDMEKLDRSSFHKKYGRPKHIVRRQLKGI